MMIKKVMFIVLALSVCGMAQAAMNDHTAPYRLAFMTSTAIGVPAEWNTAASLDGPDGQAQMLANNAGVGAGGYITDLDGNPFNVVWKALASTLYVDARDHTGTGLGDISVPIYLIGAMNDGVTLVATGNADLWDGSPTGTIQQDENGNAIGGWPFTGSYKDGTLATDAYPSHGRGFDSGSIQQANSGVLTDMIWRQWTARPPTGDGSQNAFYAISGVIPEPATMLLLGLGGLLIRRKR